MHRSRHLVAYAVALLLVFAQQAAFTHLIGHLGGDVSAETIAAHEDREHGEALSLTHNCATCVALAALGGPPSAPFQLIAAAMRGDTQFAASAIPAQFRHTSTYSARAPPAVL